MGRGIGVKKKGQLSGTEAQKKVNCVAYNQRVRKLGGSASKQGIQ